MREERFRLLFDNARTGMMFLSVDGRLRRSNQAMVVLLGYTDQELLAGTAGRTLWSSKWRTSAPAGMPRWRRRIR